MKHFGKVSLLLLGLILGAVLGLGLFAGPAFACSAHGCGPDSYCSGGVVEGIFCVAIEEGGVRTCGQYACEGGGGGGQHDWPLTYTLPQVEGAPAPKIDRFKGMTLAQALAACSVTPGCTMSSGDQVLMRRAPTWGALKIKYR